MNNHRRAFQYSCPTKQKTNSVENSSHKICTLLPLNSRCPAHLLRLFWNSSPPPASARTSKKKNLKLERATTNSWFAHHSLREHILEIAELFAAVPSLVKISPNRSSAIVGQQQRSARTYENFASSDDRAPKRSTNSRAIFCWRLASCRPRVQLRTLSWFLFLGVLSLLVRTDSKSNYAIWFLDGEGR